ncbi:MAG: hypothetical protein ABSA02_20440 [Trebonia sp.]|jgi:hypothetical protein
MAEAYTIESADDSVPINPRLLRELRDLLREDDDLDLGLTLKDRPPAPGEQGAIPVALEIITTATPLAAAFAGVLMHWINSHKVRIKVRHGHDMVEIRAGSVQDAERLIALLRQG